MAASRIGRALRRFRAGDAHTAWEQPALAAAESITFTSTAFGAGQPMPRHFAGAGVGDDVSPPLSWSGIPEAAAELVLVIEDPDAPLPRPFVHCLAVGIPPQTTGIPENALANGTAAGITLARGSFRTRGYGGPRPVPGHGTHRYLFQLFAFGAGTGLGADSTVRDLSGAGPVLARGRLIGTYERD